MLTDRPKRLESFDYLGPHRYFLTFCTDGRHRAFSDAGHVSLVQRQILRAADDCGFELVAYCFMPDHVHLLLDGRHDAADCRAFITRSKQFSGFYYARETHRRLWQRYVYERTLRSDEASLGVTRYILENPLRAGLARRIQDYPFVGSSLYTIEQLLDAVQMIPAWSRTSGSAGSG